MTSTDRARAAAGFTESQNGGEIVVPEQKPPRTLGEFLPILAPELQRALPTGMSADRVARLALTAIRQSELQAKKSGGRSLAECTPASFAGALLTCCALGLEPNLGGEAYLVAYRDKQSQQVECQLIVGYHGLTKLFWQHPLARNINAETVYSRDVFHYTLGLHPTLRHEITDWEDRGDPIAYYATAELTTGAYPFVVLSAAEVQKLRGGKIGPKGDIPDPQRWMERKTALRQLIKLLPKSPQMRAALDVDEMSGADLIHQVPSMEPAVIDADGGGNDPEVAALTEGIQQAESESPAVDEPVDITPPPRPGAPKRLLQRSSKTRDGLIGELKRQHEGASWEDALYLATGERHPLDRYTDNEIRAAIMVERETVADWQTDNPRSGRA